jgi:hypothetical protein
MKIHKSVVVLLVLQSSLLLHAKNKKPTVPAVFGQAQYVYVEAIDGKEFDPNLNPDDRIAIADVRDALDNWKRYTLTTSREDAQLVVVVRKGRAAGANVDIAPYHGQFPGSAGQPGEPGSIGSGAEIGAEAGPPDDLLEVCQVNPDGKMSSPLWEQSMPEGLNAPKVMLLRQFEEAVDKAYPPQPPAAKSQTQQTSQRTGQQQPAQSQKP